MSNEPFYFKNLVVTQLQPDTQAGPNKVKILCTEFDFEVSDNLEPSSYYKENGMLTPMGSEATTINLVQGLINNIHMSHQEKYKDSAQHLREIINMLEQGFIAIAQVEKGEFTYNDINKK